MIEYEEGLWTATCDRDGAPMELVGETTLDFGDATYTFECTRCGDIQSADLSDFEGGE